jgi:hypothetical protein
MTCHGHIHKGTIVLEEDVGLPDGAKVEIELKHLRREDVGAARNVAKLADGLKYDFDALSKLREANKL